MDRKGVIQQCNKGWKVSGMKCLALFQDTVGKTDTMDPTGIF